MRGLRRIESILKLLAGAVIGTYLSRLQRGKIDGNSWVYAALTLAFIGTAYLVERYRKRLEQKEF